MKGSWRDLEKWISREVFGYPSIINNFCFDYRHAFRILRKFPSWKWDISNNVEKGRITVILNATTVTHDDIPKAISLATYAHLQGFEWKYEPSEYERKDYMR